MFIEAVLDYNVTVFLLYVIIRQTFFQKGEIACLRF